MSPFPTEMRDRWQGRSEPSPGQGTVYWHILFRDHPQVCATARTAQERLANFTGLHMTPQKWLHATALAVGSTDEITSNQMGMMVSEVRQVLSTVQPVSVTLGRVLYHPEAIALEIRPKDALDPILKGVQYATRMATGKDRLVDGSLPKWPPHVTLSYSTARQPVGPIVDVLGKELPGCEVRICTVSLVIQWGPERLWNWELVGTAQLGTHEGYSRRRSLPGDDRGHSLSVT